MRSIWLELVRSLALPPDGTGNEYGDQNIHRRLVSASRALGSWMMRDRCGLLPSPVVGTEGFADRANKVDSFSPFSFLFFFLSPFFFSILFLFSLFLGARRFAGPGVWGGLLRMWGTQYRYPPDELI